ncbi:hypothetical protein BDR26DRAFT_951799 [Obelidium mucronatum]|nr:hypothetical protein BDR26DRAFT_951799 [Obelidium mucronatum]
MQIKKSLDASKQFEKVDLRTFLPSPFSRNKYMDFELAITRYIKTLPANHLIWTHASDTPRNLDPEAPPSLSALINEQQIAVRDCELFNNLISQRIFNSTRRHVASPEALVDSFNGAATVLYPSGELPAIHQIMWQDPNNAGIQLDIDNELDLEEAQLFHRHHVNILLSDHKASIEAMKLDCQAIAARNKEKDAATQSNGKALKALFDNVDEEIRGDLRSFTSIQAAINFLNHSYWADPTSIALAPEHPSSGDASSNNAHWTFVSDLPANVSELPTAMVPESEKHSPSVTEEIEPQSEKLDNAINDVVEYFPEVFQPVPAELNPEKEEVSNDDTDGYISDVVVDRKKNRSKFHTHRQHKRQFY